MVQAAPAAGTMAQDSTVVLVNPAAGGGRSGSIYYSSLAEQVSMLIDAVEVWNGNWTDDQYVDTAARIAHDLGLPATGGSDAHRADRIGRCATEIEGDVRSTADVVAAIKAGTVAPVAPLAPQNGGRRVGHLLDLFRR